MFKPSVTGPTSNHFRELERHIREKAEQAILEASHESGLRATSQIRSAMSGAGLGRLGKAIDATSDLDKGGRLYRSSSREVSASSTIHLKSRSERTVGAIEAYTQGATILPRAGSWLWIPSSELQRRVKGGKRVTPANWRTSGLERRIGPLVKIQGKHPGEALLIVPAVTVRTAEGKRPTPLKLSKTGRIKAGRVLRENFIAFTGIRSTYRQARVNPHQIIEGVRAELPSLIAAKLEK